MNKHAKFGILLIAVTQTLHSLEEYVFALWEVFDVARFLSGLISSNLEVGFVVINASIVVLAYWSYFYPVRQDWPIAIGIAWFWIVLEFGNSVGHFIFSVNAEAYFPGIYTAPLLFVASAYTAYHLLSQAPSAEKP